MNYMKYFTLLALLESNLHHLSDIQENIACGRESKEKLCNICTKKEKYFLKKIIKENILTSIWGYTFYFEDERVINKKTCRKFLT